MWVLFFFADKTDGLLERRVALHASRNMMSNRHTHITGDYITLSGRPQSILYTHKFPIPRRWPRWMVKIDRLSLNHAALANRLPSLTSPRPHTKVPLSLPVAVLMRHRQQTLMPACCCRHSRRWVARWWSSFAGAEAPQTLFPLSLLFP